METLPIEDDLTIRQGSTFTKSWQYSVSLDGVSAQPVDLSTGWIGRSECRDRAGGSRLYYRLHSVDPAADAPIDLRADGTVALHIPPALSAGWSFRRGVYDVELEHVATGRVVPIAAGRVRLIREVTTGA